MPIRRSLRKPECSVARAGSLEDPQVLVGVWEHHPNRPQTLYLSLMEGEPLTSLSRDLNHGWLGLRACFTRLCACVFV